MSGAVIYMFCSVWWQFLFFNVVESFDSSKNKNEKEACCLLSTELPLVFDISAVRGPSTKQLESFRGFLNSSYRVSWYKAVL